MAQGLVESRLECLKLDVDINGAQVSKGLREKIELGVMRMLADVIEDKKLREELVDKEFNLQFTFKRGHQKISTERKEEECS